MLPSRPLFASIASGASVTAAIVIGRTGGAGRVRDPLRRRRARSRPGLEGDHARRRAAAARTHASSRARAAEAASRPAVVREGHERPTCPAQPQAAPAARDEAFRAKASEQPADGCAGRASPSGPRGKRAARREPGPGREHPRAHQGPPAWTPRLTRPRALQSTILGHVASGRRVPGADAVTVTTGLSRLRRRRPSRRRTDLQPSAGTTTDVPSTLRDTVPTAATATARHR